MVNVRVGKCSYFTVYGQRTEKLNVMGNGHTFRNEVTKNNKIRQLS